MERNINSHNIKAKQQQMLFPRFVIDFEDKYGILALIGKTQAIVAFRPQPAVAGFQPGTL